MTGGLVALAMLSLMLPQTNALLTLARRRLPQPLTARRLATATGMLRRPRSRAIKAAEQEPSTDVRGIVSDTIFRSDSGYAVVRLKLLAPESQEELPVLPMDEVVVTAKTGLENAHKGQQLRVRGAMVESKFGRQLEAVRSPLQAWRRLLRCCFQ